MNDLELYEANADRWWNANDRFFRSLRSVGQFHLGLLEREWGHSLDGSRVAELGCGGGFMALALSKLGAKVVGVDSSAASIAAAQDEAERQGVECEFVCEDIRCCSLPSESFDLAVMNDVLEHLEDPQAAILEASRLLKSGGRLFVNTFDRSWLSRVAVVGLAEGIGLVPRGTHDPSFFIRPVELQQYAADSGMTLDQLVWERPALLRTAWTWTIHLKEAKRGLGYSAFLSKGNS